MDNYYVKGNQWPHSYETGLSYFLCDRLSVPQVTHCPTLPPHYVLTVGATYQANFELSKVLAQHGNWRFFNLKAVELEL